MMNVYSVPYESYEIVIGSFRQIMKIKREDSLNKNAKAL